MRFWHFVSPRAPVLCDMFFRSSRPEVFCKKGVVRNFAKFTGKHLCQSLFLNKVPGLRPSAYNFNKKETLAQAFSCEFCEISKNTFCYRTALVAILVLQGAVSNLSIIKQQDKQRETQT